MNTEQLNAQWKQVKGAVRQQWGKLTDNDLEAIAGKKDILIGKIQERYGMAKEEAQRKADDWLRTFNPPAEQAFGHKHEEHATSGRR